MCNSAARAARRKYGRYMPYQRANVDQVPLPFVNDMDTTYEQKGATRVAINQNGPTLVREWVVGGSLGYFGPCHGFLRPFSEWPVMVS